MVARRRGIPVEYLSLDEPAEPRRRAPPGRDPRRPHRIDDLAAAIDRSTRVLAISHVEFASGFRNDLDALVELCHGRGVALFRRCDPGPGPALDRRPAHADWISWQPTATNGCSGPRVPASSTCAATGSTDFGPSASAGTAWSARTTRRAMSFGSSPQPALGRRLVQHARPAGLRRQPGLVPGAGPRARSRAASWTAPRPCASWPSQLAGDLPGSRRESDRSAIVCSSVTGSIPSLPSRRCGGKGSWLRAGGPAPLQPASLQRRGRPRPAAPPWPGLIRPLPIFDSRFSIPDPLRLDPRFPTPSAILESIAMKPLSTDPYRTAVFTGTFDPFSLGHLDVIQRGRLPLRAPGRRHRHQRQQGVAFQTWTSASRWLARSWLETVSQRLGASHSRG